jgi:hypothetical protein
MSMGESVMLHDAWLLLKDFSFRRNLPEEYYKTLPERMVRQMEERRPLEHVDGRVHPHYVDRKQERYNENQALPREFNTRAAKKYKFTLEDIMMFMANDVASQHPELKQVMNMRLPASDKSLPNRDPSVHFDAFQTSRPKATEHGLQHLVTPHFTINPRSKKLQLKTVGSGAMSDKSRQSIHAKPTTSPIVNDNHDNAKIHESLPQRFDFMERETPPGQAVETASPIQPDEPDDKYSHLSPPFAARMREIDAQRQSNSNDNVETGEPMDIAMRLLKNDDERRKIEEFFENSIWATDADEGAKDYYFTMGYPLTPFNRMSDRQIRLFSQMVFNHGTDGQPNVPAYWREPFQEAGHDYATEILMGDGMEHIPDEAYDELIRYHQHFNDAVEALPGGPNPQDDENRRHHTEIMELREPGAVSPSGFSNPHDTAQRQIASEHPHWGTTNEGDFIDHYGINHANRQIIPQMDNEGWQDSIEASEPMDIAMRLLKRDLSEMTDYEIDRARFANDNPELQSEERTRAMDRMAEFGRQNVTPFDYGDEVEEAYDDIGDQDHSDYFGEDIDPNELYQYILENAGEEAAQNYVQQYKDARAKYGGNAATMGQLDNYGISNQGDVNDFIESRERMTGDMRNIMPDDETVFDAFPYPEGVVYNNKLSPPFTTTPQNESNFQMKYTGEPMDIALRLLKENKLPNFCSSCQGAGCEECDNTGMHRTERFHQENEPMSVDDIQNYSGERQLGYYGEEPNPMESFQDIIADTPVGRKKQTGIMGRTYRGKPTFNMIPLAGAGRSMINPHAEIFRRSEPMDIALRLLKNFVLEPDNPEQAYFQSSMGYHPETGKVGYVPNTEVDPLNDVSINLAHPKQFMLRDRDGNPVDDGAGFDQFVQRVDKDLLHEHTHGAIDREIRQAYKDKILPSENVFSAHEVGAIAAQNPGEGFANQRGADRVSESETKHHPTTRDWRAEQSPFADGRWSPQPAYSSNSEEGWE